MNTRLRKTAAYGASPSPDIPPTTSDLGTSTYEREQLCDPYVKLQQRLDLQRALYEAGVVSSPDLPAGKWVILRDGWEWIWDGSKYRAHQYWPRFDMRDESWWDQTANPCTDDCWPCL